MSDREEFLNSLSGNDPAPDADPIDPPEVVAGDPVDPPAEQEIKEPAESAGALEGKEASAFLDSLTNGQSKAADQDPPKGEEDSAKAKAETDADKAKDATPAVEKTLEEQEAEALEGVKSERGKERIRATFAKLRDVETKATQYEADINEFRDMVKSTGMAPQQFAQTLEFGRLMNSGKEDDLKLALSMVESQRELLCKQLGIEAPGVDPLSDFPDLRADVENMAVTKERALEVAKFRRQQQQQQAVQQSQQQQDQERQQWEQSIAQVSKTAQTYFATREKEADYPAKMQQIAAKFKDPAFMQEFVSTYQPPQWFGVMKMMYDSITVQAPRQQSTSQPIRSRSTMAGAPVANQNESSTDRLTGLLDSMGI